MWHPVCVTMSGLPRHGAAQLLKPFTIRGGMVVAMLLIFATPSSRAIEMNGSARVFRGRSDLEVGPLTTRQDSLNQFYSLTLSQSIGPWLGFKLGYLYTDFDTDTAGVEFYRTSRMPSFLLGYNRENFSTFLQYTNRMNRSSNEFQNLDIESILANFNWTPDRGPNYNLQFRQDTNEAAQTATFGRDTRTRGAKFGLIYDKSRVWAGSYQFELLDLDNRESGAELNQVRHNMWGSYNNRFWADRIDLGVDARLDLADQEQTVPAGDVFGEPVPAVDGLYALDSTPDISTLGVAPDLDDGDVVTPARTGGLPGDPPIQIGGANIDRNLGLDLGIIRPMSRMQVYVDVVSGPNIIWQVYASTDNLNWALIDTVTAFFDQPFLRYDISFTETSSRFFKVVNVSTNSQPNVAVTELRAFLDLPVTPGERVASDADIYQFAGRFSIAPTERVTAYFNLSYNEDRSALGGLVGRKTVNYTYDARMAVQSSRFSMVQVRYRFSDFEQKTSPQVFNTDTLYSASYLWTPPRSVATEITASRRLQSDRGNLLRGTDRLFAEVSADLLPSVRARGSATFQDTTDPFNGYDQKSYRLSTGMEGNLTSTARIFGNVSVERFQFTGVVDLTLLALAETGITWAVNPFVNFIGQIRIRDEERDRGDQRSVNQRYSLSWSPGTRLTTALFYQDNDDDQGVRITSAGANLNYRINPRFTIFGTASRSTTTSLTLPRRQVLNLLAGLNFNF